MFTCRALLVTWLRVWCRVLPTVVRTRLLIIRPLSGMKTEGLTLSFASLFPVAVAVCISFVLDLLAMATALSSVRSLVIPFRTLWVVVTTPPRLFNLLNGPPTSRLSSASKGALPSGSG